MTKFFTLSTAALLLSSASAMAQPAPDAGAGPGNVAEAGLPPVEGIEMPAASDKPDSAVSAANPGHEGRAHAAGDAPAPASFSQAEIDGYVTAAMAVQEMQADSTLDATAQQDRAAAILAEAGLDAATFNAISDAVQSDPAVAERVQLAIANRRGSPGA